MEAVLTFENTILQPIIWDDSFDVGIDSLNRQHKDIFNMVNRLIESEAKLKMMNSVSLADCFFDLNKLLNEHFHHEEQVMKEIGYPDLGDHAMQHAQYFQVFGDFLMDAIYDKENTVMKLREFLVKFWLHHIKNDDMKIKEFLENKG